MALCLDHAANRAWRLPGVASSAPTLDYSGKRQALSGLGVQVAVYPRWHESPYRWVMSAFEMNDGAQRLWVDGEAIIQASAAASLSGRRGETRTG